MRRWTLTFDDGPCMDPLAALKSICRETRPLPCDISIFCWRGEPESRRLSAIKALAHPWEYPRRPKGLPSLSACSIASSILLALYSKLRALPVSERMAVTPRSFSSRRRAAPSSAPFSPSVMTPNAQTMVKSYSPGGLEMRSRVRGSFRSTSRSSSTKNNASMMASMISCSVRSSGLAKNVSSAAFACSRGPGGPWNGDLKIFSAALTTCGKGLPGGVWWPSLSFTSPPRPKRPPVEWVSDSKALFSTISPRLSASIQCRTLSTSFTMLSYTLFIISAS
mmetsp:Transcript_4160/g.9820  ORF Transcript_4160/g.9820 Transcript_4160/m.9820 type:complete len:279 (+) Transcript_4160:676-1512(+)